MSAFLASRIINGLPSPVCKFVEGICIVRTRVGNNQIHIILEKKFFCLRIIQCCICTKPMFSVMKFVVSLPEFFNSNAIHPAYQTPWKDNP
jgi:hypothetical protein